MNLSFAVGMYAVLLISTEMGLVYVAIVLLGKTALIFAFCSKCVCRAECGHVLHGKLTRLLPARKQGPYSALDYVGLLIPLALMLAFPQFWLWQNKALLFVFWAAFVVAMIKIRMFVCRSCGNEICPGHIK